METVKFFNGREQIKIDIPIDWQKKRNAGLCPVCGKDKSEFEKNRKVYCSEKCSLAWSEKILYWSSLRDKIISKNPKCTYCRITRESWEKGQEKRINALNQKIMKEYEEIIYTWKMKKIAIEEQQFIEHIKRIEKADLFDHSLNHFLEYYLKLAIPKTEQFKGFEVDHKIAIVNGGDAWNENNLQVLCKNCHIEKTKKDIKQHKEKKQK